MLNIIRGDGTYVSTGKQTLSAAVRKKTVANVLREAAVQAIHLEISVEQAKELLEKEYQAIKSAKKKSE